MYRSPMLCFKFLLLPGAVVWKLVCDRAQFLVCCKPLTSVFLLPPIGNSHLLLVIHTFPWDSTLQTKIPENFQKWLVKRWSLDWAWVLQWSRKNLLVQLASELIERYNSYVQYWKATLDIIVVYFYSAYQAATSGCYYYYSFA